MAFIARGDPLSRFLVLAMGIFVTSLIPQLPDFYVYLTRLLTATFVYAGARCLIGGHLKKCYAITDLLFIFLWGFCWGLFSANNYLDSRLPEKYHGRDFVVSGSLIDISVEDQERIKFTLDVHSAALDDALDKPLKLKKLMLTHYLSADPRLNLALKVGQHWQFKVRLKSSRGLLNPGSFDRQKMLVERRYSAIGYVRDSAINKLIHPQPRLSIGMIRTQVAKLRSYIATSVMKSDTSHFNKAILVALTVGDRRMIRPWWEDLSRLGIVHLIVISGLHIGIVGGWGYFVGSIFTRILRVLQQKRIIALIPEYFYLCAPLVTSLLFASIYSLLAGFTLPTQRALTALIVVLSARLFFKQVNPWLCFCVSLCFIAFVQPFAILGAGFWLSFVAVATLIGWFYPWHANGDRFRSKIVSAQFILVVVMFLPLSLALGRASWIAPLINMFAIPIVSIIIVPAALVGTLVLAWSQSNAMLIWKITAIAISPLQILIQNLPHSIGFFTLPVALSFPVAVAFALGCLILFLPIKIKLRILCLMPLIAAMLYPKHENTVLITILDVGQGLSVVLEVEGRTMIYDAGPRYGESYNAGDAIVQPFLRSRGNRTPDVIVISHEDTDHSGGFGSLADSFPSAQLIHGPGVSIEATKVDQPVLLQSEPLTCSSGHHWYWPVKSHEMQFSFLWPSITGPQAGNDSSCVLLISWSGHSILLTGDITQVVEKKLIESKILKESEVTLLIAPHHGSKSSSSFEFIQYTSPQHVVFSSGYKHHYGHPHEGVVARYKKAGTKIWSTADDGAVSFSWSIDNELKVHPRRRATFFTCITCRAWWR